MLAIQVPTWMRRVAAPMSCAVAMTSLFTSAAKIASNPASSASRAIVWISLARQPIPGMTASPSRSAMGVSFQLGEWLVAEPLAREPSGLLDHLLVNHLDVDADAAAIPPQWILGHPCLVFRRELIRDLALHLIESGAVGRRLLHGGDEVDEIPAEKGEPALGDDLAVARDDVGEVELLEIGQALHPLLW